MIASPNPTSWLIAAEEELNRIQGQLDNCCLEQDEVKDPELKKALLQGYKEAQSAFTDAVLKYSNEAAALGLSFSFQSLPQPEDGDYNRIKVYVQPSTLCVRDRTQCSSLTNFSAVSADSAKLPKSPGDSVPAIMLTSTSTPNLSIDIITQASASTAIFDPIIQIQEPTYIASDSPAPAHQELVLELDLITPNPVFGLKPCDVSSRGVQTMWLLKTLKVLSTEDYGRFLGDSEWQGIRGTIRNSYRQLGLELLTAGTDFSSLPTPTSYAEGFGRHRPAGTNKLERALKLLPTVTASTGGVTVNLTKGGNRLERSLLPTPVARDGKGPTGTPNESLSEPIQEYLAGTDKMSPAVPGWMMGFQPGYVEKILMAGGAIIPHQDIQGFQPEPQDAEPASNSTDELLCPSKLRSHSAESFTSTAFSNSKYLEVKPMIQLIAPINEGNHVVDVSPHAPDVSDKSESDTDAIDRYLERRAHAEGEEELYPKEEWVSPHDIILDCGTQSRPFDFDREKLDDYIEDMKSGDWDMERHPLPEICLAPDGRYYAVDCHHRVQAALESLHPGRNMLFLVQKGTLAQARLWSAGANTKHGLGADNSPQGVRKRIEMFLDNIEELSEEEYQAEFLKVPDLTSKEKIHGKFSDRTIVRYLRLRPNQRKTVQNIIKERRLGGKIAHFEVGQRIEVFFPADIEPDERPKGFVEGDAGTIEDKDNKVGLWVKWDKSSAAPFPINPDFVRPSDKPKPKPQPPIPSGSNNGIRSRSSSPTSITGSSSGGGSVTFSSRSQEKRVLPDTGRNEDATAQDNPTPSPIGDATTQQLKQWDKVWVTSPDSIYYEREGTITSIPNASHAIVELEPTDSLERRRDHIALTDLALIKQIHVQPLAQPEDVNLVKAVATVVDNLHLLRPEELKELEDAIAAFKANWSQAA